MRDFPIGIFDSGIGGLTVLREVQRLLPEENLIYFCDSARLPYGAKSPEAIQRSTLKCVSFLEKRGIKLLLIACHTVSAHVSIDRSVAMIQPSFDLLMAATKKKRAALLGTPSTIASGVYQELAKGVITLLPVACPLFVSLAEEQFFSHKATDLIAGHYLQSLREKDVDVALLACTHYPLLREAIQKALGPSIQIIDPAVVVAEEAKRRLAAENLLREGKKGTTQFFVTDRLKKFSSLAEIILGRQLPEEEITLVDLD